LNKKELDDILRRFEASIQSLEVAFRGFRKVQLDLTALLAGREAERDSKQ